MYTISLETQTDFELAYRNLTKKIYGESKSLNNLDQKGLKEFLLSKNQEGDIVSCCIYYPQTEMRFENKEVCCFGFFESLDDKQSVNSLVNYIIDRFENDTKTLFAPIDGNTWNQYRLSINQEQLMYPMDIANPKYYSELLLEAGFDVARNYSSHIVTKLQFDKDLYSQRMNKMKEIGVRIRNINLDQFDSELDQVYDLCMISFKNSFLFSPIDREDFKQKYIQIKDHLQEDYIWMAVDENEKLICFLFGITFPVPDGKKAYMAKTLARLPEDKYAGVGALLGDLLQMKAIEDDCNFGINAFMEQENVSTILSEKLSASVLKSYALFKYSKEE